MKVAFAKPFLVNFRKIPQPIKRKFEKQLGFLLKDIRHPFWGKRDGLFKGNNRLFLK